MSLLGTIDRPGGFRHKAPFPRSTPPVYARNPNKSEAVRPDMPLDGAALGFPARPDDLLLVLLSGGGSALLAAPNDWIITSSEALRGLAALVQQLDPVAGPGRLQEQHLVVPHARIAETASTLGCSRVTLTGSGDARLFAALQLQE